jgi:hypothetical protein
MMIGSLPLPREASPWLPRFLAAVGAVCILLGAAGCSCAPAAAQSPLRVLIEFREPVEGAAPDLLSRLGRSSGVSIRYAAAVSPKLHAYELACPAGDPHCDAAIRSLRRDPAVLDISPDQLRKPLDTPP